MAFLETAWNMVTFFEGGIIIKEYLDENRAKVNGVMSNQKTLIIIDNSSRFDFLWVSLLHQ